MYVYSEPRSYTKLYEYYCNKKMKQKEELFYQNKNFEAKVIHRYNKRGDEISNEYYDQEDVLKWFYTMASAMDGLLNFLVYKY